MILVCDYYEKISKKEKIVELSDGSVMTDNEYEQFTQKWEELGTIAQLPVVINRRKTSIIKVIRYRLIETQIIEYHETIFKGLPLIFVDGDSEYLRNGDRM
uniref:portal protein n=1 Tax=Rickettsiella massiliensis TaxID=676517 RepID=UPI00029A3303